MGWKLLPDLSVPKVNIAGNVLSSLRETALDRVAFEPWSSYCNLGAV